MLKMILLLARRTFIRLLLVLLPLGLFAFLAQAIPLSPLQSLVVLIPVIAFEVWLVVKYLLPVMGDLVTKTLYSSNITTDEEVLVDAARRMLNSGDPQGALELLERYRKENPALVRSWLMESSLLNDMRRYADSVEVLQEGLESRRWRKEDRALFLYKIGVIYDSQLNNPDKARKYWEEAADRYPNTAYGRSALDKL
ncbi:MAG: tetratricopeptide repeat protein [Akkermansia sp.]|uniref:tetratricopeptide repeat protein n=1 Tax=Akkermansia sp. TaxID=1872421 RepID=UPI0025BFA890|nr:tetratricopeptide repeat protein [Akkermansia sp.]MBS5508451.1 tetratricopeptide repeat protein [Akkermansia sp.]MCD8064527.1 tetratricopeptide repeat protein [Akkermansia sp.]